jgi:hypothetical protein
VVVVLTFFAPTRRASPARSPSDRATLARHAVVLVVVVVATRIVVSLEVRCALN